MSSKAAGVLLSRGVRGAGTRKKVEECDRRGHAGQPGAVGRVVSRDEEVAVMVGPVCEYEGSAFGARVTVRLLSVEDLEAQVGPCKEYDVRGAVCGARISGDLDRLLVVAGEDSDGDGWGTVAAFAAEVFGEGAAPRLVSLVVDAGALGQLAAPIADSFLLGRFPADAPLDLLAGFFEGATP